jgi:hypothetical protein
MRSVFAPSGNIRGFSSTSSDTARILVTTMQINRSMSSPRNATSERTKQGADYPSARISTFRSDSAPMGLIQRQEADKK